MPNTDTKPSFYRFTCVCEREIESPWPVGECPHCKRLFDVTAWCSDRAVVK